MMKFKRATALVLALGCLTGFAQADSGYLAPGDRPDLTQILPPPPAPGSARAEADRRIYVESRKLKGSPRWQRATDDVSGSQFDHFACALGIRLTKEEAPVLTRLLDRAGADRSVVGDAKRHWQTQRPWIGNDLPICEPRTDHLAGNGDYPSGHAAHGEHVAMILAAIAPDRKTQLLARGREFGDSRWICGSHSQSAAQAGTLSGAVIFAAEMNSAAFRADLERARAELARLRAEPHAAPEPCGANH
ncbi:MAG: phosphatidic acid phosphatase [Sphingomonas sp.]|nr:phosphatidic acid phosphatase [Sphingomonas sp.]